MSVVLSHPPPPQAAELVPRLFDPASIAGDNAALDPKIVASLVASFQEHGGQQNPGWLCLPGQASTEGKEWLCFEGCHRLEACRLTQRRFLAFAVPRHIEEDERIRLTFLHNGTRRTLKPEEVAQRAARYIELKNCSHAVAAIHLGVSAATLSRAFGEKRIPSEFKARAEALPLSVRSILASLPLPLMGKALHFAEKTLEDGRKPTRDQVHAFSRQLRQSSKTGGERVKSLTLLSGHHRVTVSVTTGDSASTLAESFKAIAAKLGKHVDVPIDGLPFLFQ